MFSIQEHHWFQPTCRFNLRTRSFRFALNSQWRLIKSEVNRWKRIKYILNRRVFPMGSCTWRARESVKPLALIVYSLKDNIYRSLPRYTRLKTPTNNCQNNEFLYIYRQYTTFARLLVYIIVIQNESIVRIILIPILTLCKYLLFENDFFVWFLNDFRT